MSGPVNLLTPPEVAYIIVAERFVCSRGSGAWKSIFLVMTFFKGGAAGEEVSETFNTIDEASRHAQRIGRGLVDIRLCLHPLGGPA